MIASPGKGHAPASVAKRVVAVVDDDYRVLESLDDLLQASGYETLLFASAELFLQLPARRTVDFLISDIALPGMSGIDLLRILRGRPGNLPVILITGRNESRFEQDAQDLGVLRLFVKPFDTDELLAMLRASFQGTP
jgi:DNA-binding response OmpR family regulator